MWCTSHNYRKASESLADPRSPHILADADPPDGVRGIGTIDPRQFRNDQQCKWTS